MVLPKKNGSEPSPLPALVFLREVVSDILGGPNGDSSSSRRDNRSAAYSGDDLDRSGRTDDRPAHSDDDSDYILLHWLMN